jgi:hypothetical protein
MRPRISTNVDTYVDAVFTGSIVGTLLTITAVNPKFTGQISLGSVIFGSGVAANTTVTALESGAGGLGTYMVTPTQAVASETLAAGTEALLQPTEVVVQLDVHGPCSADNAQVISTLFRDDFAVQQFATSGFDVTPLYAEDPKQVPFINAEQAFEDRWIVDVHMQANQTIVVPQQFAQAIKVVLHEIDASYPP